MRGAATLMLYPSIKSIPQLLFPFLFFRMFLSSALFIFLSDSSVILVSLLLRKFWSLWIGPTLVFRVAVDRRSLTFFRKIKFSAFATSFGDDIILPLCLMMLGVLLNDLFEVFQ